MRSSHRANRDYRPFGLKLNDIVVSKGIIVRSGNVNWPAFADRLPGVGYETLRKAIVGERIPTLELIQTVALALGVRPTVFAEYRLHRLREQFDPKSIGLDKALRNLQRYEHFQENKA